MPLSPRSITMVRSLVRLIAAGRYADAAASTRGRLNAEAIEQAVLEYGVPLSIPPESIFESLDAVASKAAPGQFSVIVPMWSDDERTDLSLEITVREHAETSDIELDDLHVL